MYVVLVLKHTKWPLRMLTVILDMKPSLIIVLLGFYYSNVTGLVRHNHISVWLTFCHMFYLIQICNNYI